MIKSRRALMAAIVLIAFALRAAPWGRDRFMEDEALYAAWGLQIATGADPMLDAEPVDKPPLYPYTLALAFAALRLPPAALPAGGPETGAGWPAATRQMETAARLPGLLASTASVALLYALARRLSGDDRVALLAAGLLAVSPFDVLFAATAFTDPLLVALVLAALLAAAAGRAGAAGLLAGLAWATKQQAILFLPLLVGVLVLGPGRRTTQDTKDTKDRENEEALIRTRESEASRERQRGAWQRVRRGVGRAWAWEWLRLALGLGVVAGGVAAWDAARVQRPGYLAQSLISYGGLGPAGTGTPGERALGWLRLAGEFWASPWVNGLLAAAVVGWLIYGGWRACAGLTRASAGDKGVRGGRDLFSRPTKHKSLLPQNLDAGQGATKHENPSTSRGVRPRQVEESGLDKSRSPDSRTCSGPVFQESGAPTEGFGSYSLPRLESGTGAVRPAHAVAYRGGLALDLVLVGFVVLFLAVHWLGGFQVWDRYLLGLAPVAALLAARALAGLGRALPRAGWRAAYAAGLPLVLLGLAIVPLSGALRGRLPVGGDHGAYDGIDQLAAAVRAEAPAGAVLYHHWLGYHYRFYLYGAPLRLHWYPDSGDLVRDAAQYAREPRYIAFPSFRDSAPVRAALAAAGIRLRPVYETTRRDGTVSFQLYRMEGPGG